MPAACWANCPIHAGRRACNWHRTGLLLGCCATLGDDRMRLVLQLVARLLIVVVLCLGAAIIWVTIDAYRSVDRATAASPRRVSQALEALYWRELLLRGNIKRDPLLPGPQWRPIENMHVIF